MRVLVVGVVASVITPGIAGARTVKGCQIKRNADCRGKNLKGANLARVDMQGANLSRANLVGADLRAANLKGVNLKGARMTRAKLGPFGKVKGKASQGTTPSCDPWCQGADLSGADLSDVDLSYANLSDANLSNANLTSAILS